MRYLLIFSMTLLVGCDSSDSNGSSEGEPVPATAILQDYDDLPGLSKATVKSGEKTLSEGDALNGKKHGTWIEYHPNGFVRALTTYYNGLIQGAKLTFSDEGQMETKAYYHNGLLEGQFQKFNRRNIVEEKNYVNGKVHGLKKAYYPNGKIQEESHYRNGIMDGIAKYYGQDGSLLYEYKYEQGKLVQQEGEVEE